MYTFVHGKTCEWVDGVPHRHNRFYNEQHGCMGTQDFKDNEAHTRSHTQTDRNRVLGQSHSSPLCSISMYFSLFLRTFLPKSTRFFC